MRVIPIKVNKYFIYLLLSIVFITSYFTFYSPSFKTQKLEMEKEIQELNNKVNNKAALEKELEELEKKSEVFKAKVYEVKSKAAFNNYTYDELFKHIALNSEAFDVHVGLFEEVEKHKKGNITETTYELDVTGPNKELIQFVDTFFQLETSFSIEEFIVQQDNQKIIEVEYSNEKNLDWSSKISAEQTSEQLSEDINLYLVLKFISIDEKGN